MKKLFVILTAILILGIIFWSCSEDSSTEADTKVPVCEITSPANNAVFNEGDSVIINCEATDNDAIVKVDFFIDDTLRYTVNTSPYEYSWSTIGKVGSHTIILKAYDPSNNVGTSSVLTIIVNSLNIPPQITDLSANPSSVVQNQQTAITRTAVDGNGDSLSYLWSADGGIINGTGSSVTWEAPDITGAYTITCMVDDGKDDDIDSVIILVSEIPDTTLPRVTLTYPSNNAEFNLGVSVTIKGDVTDNDTVSKVEFYIDSINNYTDVYSPYEFTWNTNGKVGVHTVFLKGYDPSNNIGISETISIEVLDITEPVVYLSQPANNSEFVEGDVVTIKGFASDNNTVTKVEFYIDGIENFSDTASPYEYSWDTTGKLGSHSIMLKAYDPSNNIGSSTVNTVKVNVFNSAPEIISLSADPSSVLLNQTTIITCTAQDNEGDTLTYDWSCNFGSLSENGSSASWTAPGTTGVFTITCFVSDSKLSDSDSIYIYVADGSTHPGMVLINGGTFQMGDHFSEGSANELPVHSVTVSDFYIGVYKVTQPEWNLYMPAIQYYHGAGDNYPVYAIDWYEILMYCNKRSIAEGLIPCYTINGSTNPGDWGAYTASWKEAICNWSANGYRLPTEAEWEYAARGGLSGQRYPSGGTISHDTNGATQANYYSRWEDGAPYYSYDVSPTQGYHPDYGVSTSPIDAFPPNGYGLYDMGSNLCEWCWDWYDGNYYTTCFNLGTVTDPRGPDGINYRARRGHAAVSMASAYHCRITYRGWDFPYDNYGNNGFRVVRTP
jgi:formylglycine-generating enzyme required for sulfatase activity